jgi:hypothetical protein
MPTVIKFDGDYRTSAESLIVLLVESIQNQRRQLKPVFYVLTAVVIFKKAVLILLS